MAKKTYKVARQFVDKNGQTVQVGRTVEMDENEAKPKVDSGELQPAESGQSAE